MTTEAISAATTETFVIEVETVDTLTIKIAGEDLLDLLTTEQKLEIPDDEIYGYQLEKLEIHGLGFLQITLTRSHKEHL